MQPKLKIEMVLTADLVPYAGNAKEHPDWQVAQIAESIKQFGFNDPVGVWHDKGGAPVIVEGHGRVLAAKELGIEQVPTIPLDHLDDEGRRAYVLAHNQLTMNTGFNLNALSAELDALSNSGIEMGDFGFDVDGLADDVAGDFEPIDDTEAGDVTAVGTQIAWDRHSVTLADDELGMLNAAYDAYVERNGVSLGLFRSILDDSD